MHTTLRPIALLFTLALSLSPLGAEILENGSFEADVLEATQAKGWKLDANEKANSLAMIRVISGSVAGERALEVTADVGTHAINYGFVTLLQQQRDEESGLQPGRYLLTGELRFISGYDSAEKTPLRAKIYRIAQGDGTETAFFDVTTKIFSLPFTYEGGVINVEIEGANYSGDPVVFVIDNLRLVPAR